MLRKALLITAISISSFGLTGCSSMWMAASNFSADMAEVTKFSFLRGPSKKSDVSFAEATPLAVDGIYATEAGEYVPTAIEIYTDSSSFVDTSPVPCPDGTYLNAENTCMFLETEVYEFEDEVNFIEQVVDTSPIPCPEGTYLNAENTCMFNEIEEYEFETEVNFTEQFVDTSPVPCPEGTFLNAENACMFLDVEPWDFALETAAPVVPASFETQDTLETQETFETQDAPSFDFTLNEVVECPEGFELNAQNSCMYLGAELKTKS